MLYYFCINIWKVLSYERLFLHQYIKSSVWRALRRETQSNRESMRPLWFFHLYILSSATTALSTLCQGRLYPHIYIYIFSVLFTCIKSTSLLCYDQWEWTSVDNQLKNEPCLLWWWVDTNGLRRYAQLNICPQFLLEFPWSYFSWKDIPRSLRRKVTAQKLLDFS